MVVANQGKYFENTYSHVVLRDNERNTLEKVKGCGCRPTSMAYSLGPFCRLSPLSLSRNILLRILPLGDLGITSMNSTPVIATY